MRSVVRPAAAFTAVLLAATVLSGCAAGPQTGPPAGSPTVTAAHPSVPDDTPSQAAPPGSQTATTTGAGSGCPAQPGGRGPADSLVVLAISGPATAPSGSTVTVSSQLVVLSDGSRVVLTPQGSSLEVLRGSTVVARTPAPSGADVPVALSAGASYPAQTLPTQVVLVGCDGTPLPAGRYGLRAVVAYGGDPLNGAVGGAGGAGRFVLLSDPPVDLTIT